MSNQDFIALNRVGAEEISERIMHFQMLYITDGVGHKCDLTNLSLDNVDFANLCKVATHKAAQNTIASGLKDTLDDIPEGALDTLANHLDFTDSIGRCTNFRTLDLTHSIMRNTYFTEPDFRGASQFFTLDVTNAHWVRPKLEMGAQLCGLSVLDMNKLEDPEFYDHQDKLIKGAYVDTDGLVKYDSTMKNTWDNARRGVDVKGAFQSYNALYSISANNNMLTNLRNGALEKMGHLLP